MILMGGPIDTRESPTAVNTLAEERGIEWFRRNCITRVPFPYPGIDARGLSGLSPTLGLHGDESRSPHLAHWEYYKHLVQDNGDSAEKHREFYDEYLAVMDLTAEFYLQTVERVFVRTSCPKAR